MNQDAALLLNHGCSSTLAHRLAVILPITHCRPQKSTTSYNMFSAKELKPEQIEALKQLAAKGANLSDLQRHLKDEEGISVTYMDMRFVILDLGIELIEEKKDEEPKADDLEQAIDAKPEPTGSVSVSMDNVTLPGAMVSGKVTFSDGESAVWMIDSSGRPGLDPDTPGYRPSQEDIAEFQTQLQSLLQEKQGGL